MHQKPSTLLQESPQQHAWLIEPVLEPLPQARRHFIRTSKFNASPTDAYAAPGENSLAYFKRTLVDEPAFEVHPLEDGIIAKAGDLELSFSHKSSMAELCGLSEEGISVPAGQGDQELFMGLQLAYRGYAHRQRDLLSTMQLPKFLAIYQNGMQIPENATKWVIQPENLDQLPKTGLAHLFLPSITLLTGSRPAFFQGNHETPQDYLSRILTPGISPFYFHHSLDEGLIAAIGTGPYLHFHAEAVEGEIPTFNVTFQPGMNRMLPVNSKRINPPYLVEFAE